MSLYPFWSYRFDVRRDVAGPDLRVLEAVAADRPPAAADLGQLHPVVRHYLEDWRRLARDEIDPSFGPPVRLGTSPILAGEPSWVLSVEFCLHDDEYADGGWVFDLWVLRLLARPTPPRRVVIGMHGPYRGDPVTRLLHADAEGVREGDTLTDLRGARRHLGRRRVGRPLGTVAPVTITG